MSEKLKQQLQNENFLQSILEITEYFTDLKNEDKFKDFIKTDNFINNIFTCMFYYNKISYIIRNYELFNRLDNDTISVEDYQSIFGKSETLIKLNDGAVTLGQRIQQHFIDNLDNISFSEKTKQIQPYLEKEPKIYSFFLSLGLGFPSEEASEIFSIFKQLYQSEYLSKNIQDDELFAYMALTYSVNEIVKAISFILHKMLIKKI